MRSTLCHTLAALALPVALLAPPASAQARLSLAASADGISVAAPSSAWSRTAFEETPPDFPASDDWDLSDAVVDLVITAPAGLTLGACDLTVAWEAGAFTDPEIEANAALFPVGSSFRPDGTHSLRLSAARLGDNVTTGSLATLATLRLRLATTGVLRAWVEAADCRAFDGVGGQTDVPVAAGDTARVAALPGDVVARTGPSTLDATRGDGSVDYDDLQVLLQAYTASTDASAPAYRAYRRKFDLASRFSASPDGLVDYADLQALLALFGRSALLP